MVHVDFKLLRWNAGYLDRQECADFLGVTVKSIRNWDRQQKAPLVVVKLLQLYCGELDALGPAWSGFRIRPGVIESDDGKAFIYPGEIRALPYVYKAAGLERHAVCKTLERSSSLYAIKKIVTFPDSPVKEQSNVVIFSRKTA